MIINNLQIEIDIQLGSLIIDHFIPAERDVQFISWTTLFSFQTIFLRQIMPNIKWPEMRI